MADELKENVTTPWMQNELTAEEISRNDPDGKNTGFWILRGKGSGRDRFISLKNLRAWIDAAALAVAYIKDNGIDGIKKAFSFSDDLSHRTLKVDASGITFTQDIGSSTVSLKEGSLHFEGSVDFEGPVTFVGNDPSTNIQLSGGSVTATGMIRGRLGNFTNGLDVFDGAYTFSLNDAYIRTQLVLGSGLNVNGNAEIGGYVTSVGVETTGRVKGRLGSFTNGLDVFEGAYTFSQNEAYIRTQLVLGSGLNVYGDAEIGGCLRSSSVQKNELENLHVESAEGNVNIHNGIVHTSEYMHGKHMMVDVYTSKDRLPSLGSAPAGALACYQNETSWKLCFWNGLNWIDIA